MAQGAKPLPATITDTIRMTMSIAQELVLLLEKPQFGLKIKRGAPPPSLDADWDEPSVYDCHDL